MNAERANLEVLPAPARSESRPRKSGGASIGLYFATLTVAAGIGHPDGLLRLPLQFWLKDQMATSPHGLALFEALACAPAYVAFLFGFLRDHWSPFRWRDQGYLVLCGLAAIGCYVWLAVGQIDYPRLLIAIVMAGAAYQLIHAAAEALMTAVAQRQAMTGRLSALNEFGEAMAGVLAALAGGWLVMAASLRTTFLVTAVITAAIVLQGFWRPRAVFPGNVKVIPRQGLVSLRVLLRHPALRPTAFVILLWSFSPAYHTALLFYLTEDVGISSSAYGACHAMDCVGITAASAIYTLLCARYPLKRLLRWSMAVGMFPGIVFLFVRNAPQAIAASFVLAIVVGFMNISIGDLLARAAPEGLEGSFRMFGVSAFAIGGSAGDVFGSWVYENGGLIPCLILEAAITLCIFPVLRLLPAALVSRCETETPAFPSVAPVAHLK